MNDFERELDWNDEIEKDSPDFILLPEGDYAFTVTELERGRHAGSDKLPPCNKAVIHLKIESPEGITMIKHNLFLHTKTEGMICAFFTAIGSRKKGERIQMNWDQVVGATGLVKLSIRTWEDKKTGELRKSNEVKKFYEREESREAKQQTTLQTQRTSGTNFTPGSF